MEIKRFESLHPHAMTVRNTVFVEEQGFVDEFDDTDKIAIHLVMYDGDTPVGVCRVFRDEEENAWLLGRFAVLREYRGKHHGSALLAAAEKCVCEMGGRSITLHAQCRASLFYQKNGYTPFGEIEYEQDCPHIAMRKEL